MEDTGSLSHSQVLLQYFLAVDLLPAGEDLWEGQRLPSAPQSPSIEMRSLPRDSDCSR